MQMDKVREMLAKACLSAGSKASWAALHEISPAYVSDVISGRKAAGKKILRALGLKKAFADDGTLIDADVISKRPSYRVWRDMKSRCQNPNHQNFRYYGARGITVCERWHSYKNFLQDMGEPPTGLSIERVNNDLGYSFENCIWATRETQQANTRRHTKAIDSPTKPSGTFSDRVKAGLAAARARGRVGGRASLCTDDEILATQHMPTSQAYKRIGFKTKAAYLRRLAAAKSRVKEKPSE